MRFSLVIIILFCSSYLFAATPAKVGTEAPYHLKRDNPENFRVVVHAVTIIKDDGTEVELFYDASGTEVDLAVNGGYTSLATATSIPGGTYTEARLYTSYTYGLKGYTSYQHDDYVPNTAYYYTNVNSTSTDDSLLSTSDTGSMPNYGLLSNTLSSSELGSGSYADTYRGISVIKYPESIDLSIPDEGSVNLRITMSVTQAFELNDSNTDTSTVVSSPRTITYQAPGITISSED